MVYFSTLVFQTGYLHSFLNLVALVRFNLTDAAMVWHLDVSRYLNHILVFLRLLGFVS